MLIDLTAPAGPVFMSRTWVNKDSETFGTFTVTENAVAAMQAIMSRIIDGDRLSYWQGVNASDAITSEFIISLRERSALAQRSIDFIALINTNAKDFTVEWSNDNGSSWDVTKLVDVTGHAEPDYRASIAVPVQANALRLRLINTQTPNERKRLGGFIAAEAQIQLSRGILSYTPNHEENAREQELGDKNISRELELRSAATAMWWAATMTFPFLTQAEKESLRALRAGGDHLTFYPYPGFIKGDVFQVLFQGKWQERPISANFGAGYNIPVTLREVRDHG